MAKKVGETFTPFSPLCSAFFRQACVLTTLLYPPRLIHQTRTAGISRVAVPLNWVNYSIHGPPHPPNPKSRNLAPDGPGTHICESGASGGVDPPYPYPKML